MVIVTPAGEREVQGPEQTSAMIDQLVGPHLTPEARQGLAAGKAEWRFQLAGIGVVRARAEMKQGGTHAGGRRTYGHSMIVDPWGEILAQQAEGEGVVLAEMDLQRIREVQASLPANANRRMN